MSGSPIPSRKRGAAGTGIPLSLNVPVTVTVQRGGKRYAVEAVLASRWTPDLGAAPREGLAARVVLLAQPAVVPPESIASSRVVVSIPQGAAARAPAIAEAPAAYGKGRKGGKGKKTAVQGDAQRYARGAVLVGRRPVPDPAALFDGGALEDAVLRLAALADLDGLAPEVARLRAYLELARTPETSEELFLDRLTLQEQLDEDRVIRAPAAWPSIAQIFDMFRSKYAVAYGKHHRAYRQEMTALMRQVEEGQSRAHALRLLNGIGVLGPPLGADAVTAMADLAGKLAACSRTEQSLGGLRGNPQCPECRVSLDVAPPSPLVRSTLAAVESALEQQQQRLSSQAVRRVLARRDEPRLDRLLQAARAADLASLVRFMDADIAQFIHTLLGEAMLDVSCADLALDLRRRFPEVGEEETGAVAATVARLLEEALKRGRKANPGKRVRLRLR